MDIAKIAAHFGSSKSCTSEHHGPLLAAARVGLHRLAATYSRIGDLIGCNADAFEPVPGLGPTELGQLIHGYCGPQPVLAMLAMLGGAAPSAELDARGAELLDAWLDAPTTTASGAEHKSTVDAGFRVVRKWANGSQPLGEVDDPANRPYVLALKTLRDEHKPVSRNRAGNGGAPAGTRAAAGGTQGQSAPGKIHPSGTAAGGVPASSGGSGGFSTHRMTRAVQARTDRRTLRRLLAGSNSRRFARSARHASGHLLPIGSRSQIQHYDRVLLRRHLDDASAKEQAVIIAVLCSGQRPEQLPGWQLVASNDAVMDKDVTTYVTLEPFGLSIRNGVNDAITHRPDKPAPLARVFYPLPDSTTPYFGALHSFALAHKGNGLLFTEDDITNCRGKVRAFAAAHNSPLRLERLSRELHVAIYDITERRAAINYIAPKSSIEPAFAPDLYYAKHESRELRTMLTESLDLIGERYGAAVGLGVADVDAGAGADADAEEPQGYVGSQVCPSDEEVRELVARLKAAIPKIAKGRVDYDGLAGFHNAYTEYVLAMFMAASGIRPFNDGFPALEPVDAHWLVDEKAQGNASARWLPMPSLAREQWAFYERHRDFVVSTFGLRDAPLWFHVASGQACPMTPALWKDVMGEQEDNALRHWIQNALRTRRWTGERISLHMGHHPRGHEPGAPFSAAEVAWHPADVDVLDAVLKSAGFEPRRGRCA